MENKNFFVGFDIGSDSVGYAVSDEEYNLCKFKGEPMWGVTLFDEAQFTQKRRAFRTARRRLDRRQQRIKLLMELFAREILAIDKDFFRRIKESYLYPQNINDKVRIFPSQQEQKNYAEKYPTIHHLIFELMTTDQPHDPRLVYLACAWLVAHRGHFLSEVDKHNIDAVTDFSAVYSELVKFIERDGEYALPWATTINMTALESALKCKNGITKKTQSITAAMFGTTKLPKTINEQYEFNYSLVLKLLAGGKVALKDLFGKDEYDQLDEKSVALNMDDERLAAIMQSIGDDSALISVLKSIFDWSVLVDALKGKKTISEAKIEIYNQHKTDLQDLKYFTKKYLPEKYCEIFRAKEGKLNYPAYIGNNNKSAGIGRKANKDEFNKYILSIFKSVSVENKDEEKFQNMLQRLEIGDFMPKQVDGDNRVIPYQLYWHELDLILENAKHYIPFLDECDSDGISGKEKVLSVFEFRVPYYVGPLKEKSDKYNHWMVRRAEGKIYPWNFEKMVDLDKSEEAFIARMTNSCSYLQGEDVLPKNSLLYSSFQVLNEINNIKINGQGLSVKAKQAIYNDVFMLPKKVTPKRIKDYLVSNNYISADDLLTGLDITVKSSLKPFLQFSSLVNREKLTHLDAERIINHATYSEDKQRFKSWLSKNYPTLQDNDINYICTLNFKDFGRLSRKFLLEIEGVNKESGEVYHSIIGAMWETNNNLMQLLSDRFTFKETIDKFTRDYYDDPAHHLTLSERLNEMYISNAIKRPIIRTLDILSDIVKVQGHAPERIFIEMTRGAREEQKNKRTDTRLSKIQEAYKQLTQNEVRKLEEDLERLGDEVHNKLQSDKIFLYFLQLGKCLYTGKEISFDSVLSGDGKYNIEHIYPRSFVKDDSLTNNKILIDSIANGDKSDVYPISPEIQENMRGYWAHLNKIGLLSDEKFKRLVRTTSFTESEKFEFINRQLVETGQSTKAVATLLKEFYPDTEIVYVKAGLVSDFRHELDFLKSRNVNDLHHAKDAYLNIVVGNVWHLKYSKQFWRLDNNNSAKVEIVFNRPVICNGKTVWHGSKDKERILKIAKKNTPHMTKYAFSRKGGLFDQMPVSAKEGLVPIKKDRPTEIYGGYNKSTATFFVLTRYKVAKKQDIMVMPVELLFADKFLSDEDFALDYARRTVESIIGKPVLSVEFLLNKRILKVNTVLSLNGLRVCITGKSGGGSRIGVQNITPFKTTPENEKYIKRLESFENKKKKNEDIVFSEYFDGISAKKNLELYDLYIEKFSLAPYKYRPANPCETLKKGRDKFISLHPSEQASILLSIQGLFGRAIKADLTRIGGAAGTGESKISSSMSNWKKNYTDVRIIDQSASGLFESVSDNLLLML